MADEKPRNLSSRLRTAAKPAHDVAISYAREDGEVADELHGALLQRQLTVFYDRDETTSHKLWGNNLNKALPAVYRNARCCVVLLSPHYFESDWTRVELQKANNALPVLVRRTRNVDKHLKNVVYAEWPDGGAVEFADQVVSKLAHLEEEQAARREARRVRMVQGLVGVAGTVAGLAVTVEANRRTRRRLEENTGSIAGQWTDFQGLPWEIVETGSELAFIGRSPNGMDVHARGTRKGSSIRAEWQSPTGRGGIAASVTQGGNRIEGMYSGIFMGPFILTR